jgi:hypothetical protein
LVEPQAAQNHGVKVVTDAELRALALKYVDGRVVTSQDVPQDLWNIVFLPLAFTANPKKTLRGVRMVYAIQGEDASTGQGINGWPIFMACRMMKVRDLRKFVDYVAEAKKVKDSFIRGAK